MFKDLSDFEKFLLSRLEAEEELEEEKECNQEKESE
jgi:hypothetical protein